jgi:hypothetical protein
MRNPPGPPIPDAPILDLNNREQIEFIIAILTTRISQFFLSSRKQAAHVLSHLRRLLPYRALVASIETDPESISQAICDSVVVALNHGIPLTHYLIAMFTDATHDSALAQISEISRLAGGADRLSAPVRRNDALERWHRKLYHCLPSTITGFLNCVAEAFGDATPADFSDDEDDIPVGNDMNEFHNLLLSCLNLTDEFAFLDWPDVAEVCGKIDRPNRNAQFAFSEAFQKNVKAVRHIVNGIAQRGFAPRKLTWDLVEDFGRRQVWVAPDSSRCQAEQPPGPSPALIWQTNPFESPI